jgi:hypothetical protein
LPWPPIDVSTADKNELQKLRPSTQNRPRGVAQAVSVAGDMGDRRGDVKDFRNA